jgi:hypothetical protein
VKTGGERGIRTPQFGPDNKANPSNDIQIAVNFGPELSRVVTAWPKLPKQLKAAILAIVGSATPPQVNGEARSQDQNDS